MSEKNIKKKTDTLGQILEGYDETLKTLAGVHSPRKYISPLTAKSINLVLRDLRVLLKDTKGAKYLEPINQDQVETEENANSEERIAIIDVILIISPYLQLLKNEI